MHAEAGAGEGSLATKRFVLQNFPWYPNNCKAGCHFSCILSLWHFFSLLVGLSYCFEVFCLHTIHHSITMLINVRKKSSKNLTYMYEI